jgi:hypothetical protein
VNRSLVLATFLALGATIAAAQAPGGIRVVRRSDRRALILMLPGTLADPSTPVELGRFILLNRTTRSPLPLRQTSDTTPSGCPRVTVHPENRICIALADGAPPLVDTLPYLLVLDSIAMAARGKPKYIGGNAILTIDPVGARVQSPSETPVRMIEVTYDIEASNDPSLDIALTIGKNGVPIPARNRRPGMPACYSRASLSFKCFIDVNVHHGDSISASLSHAGARFPVKSAKDTISDAVGLGTKDTSQYSISVQGGLSQTNTSQTATVQALWRNMPIAALSTVRAADGWTFEGSLSPYLDLLWTTDASTKGYINPGVQYTADWSLAGKHAVDQLVGYLTPRSEADKKLSVVNFIPLDFVVEPRIRYLDNGPLPLGGSYSIWPRAGVEIGWTIKGQSVARPETNSPSRFKAGVAVEAKWPAPKDPPPLCRLIGCGGFDISADYQHYSLNNVPAHVTSQRDNGTLSATYKFTAHVGLSFSLHNGNPPPLFSYQRTLSLGVQFVY